MRADQFARLGDQPLLLHGRELVRKKRLTDVALLVWVGEVDARKLYLREGHPSMLAYCEQVLQLSCDVALKYLQVAKAVRKFPTLLDALVHGRIHVTGARLLAPHLTDENVSELVKSAEHQTKAAIERLVAARFPRSEVLPMVQPLVRVSSPPERTAMTEQAIQAPHVGESTDSHAPGHAETHMTRPQVAALSGHSFELHFSVSKDVHDKLCRAQELLSHRVQPGDLAEIFERALDALITHAEKTQLAATDRPQKVSRASTNRRHIPAQVKRAVRARDGDQCAYVAENGQRCQSRSRLQFDHIVPVARGGRSTASNVRRLCTAHNQLVAEQLFGAGFMKGKRARLSGNAYA